MLSTMRSEWGPRTQRKEQNHDVAKRKQQSAPGLVLERVSGLTDDIRLFKVVFFFFFVFTVYSEFLFPFLLFDLLPLLRVGSSPETACGPSLSAYPSARRRQAQPRRCGQWGGEGQKLLLGFIQRASCRELTLTESVPSAKTCGSFL